MSLPNYLAKIKSSGIYRFVWDKSEIAGNPAETLRLVVGYSEVGPFNTPVYVESASQFRTIYGNISKKLEKRGVFFHRLALQALETGPILALNLKKFDKEQVQGVSFNANSVIYNDYDNKIKNVGIEKIFDTTRFWALEPSNLPTIGGFNGYINIASADSIESSNTIFVRGTSNSQLDVTIKEWYSTINTEDEMPDYLEDYQDCYVSDFLAEIYVFRGQFTEGVVTTSSLRKYFDVVDGQVVLKSTLLNAFGEEIDCLDALSNDENSSFINKYTGILLPDFKDSTGVYNSLDLVFNSDYATHKMMMKLDSDVLEMGTINASDLITIGANNIVVKNGVLNAGAAMSSTSLNINTLRAIYNEEYNTISWEGSDNPNILLYPFTNESGEQVGESVQYTFEGEAAKALVAIGVSVGDRFVAETQGKLVVVTKFESSVEDDATEVTITFNGTPLVYEDSEYGVMICKFESSLTTGTYNVIPTYLEGYVYENAYPTITVIDPETHQPVQKKSNTQLAKLNWQNTIMDALVEYPGIRTALTSRKDCEYRYIVDTFEAFVEPECHSKIAIIAKEKDNCVAFLNFPSAQTFKTCEYASFTDTNGRFQVKYIKDGANKQKPASKLFSLVSETNGASYSSYNTPLMFSDGTLKYVVPAAAIVSNVFMSKYTSRQPYYICAGATYGRMIESGMIGPDINYSRADLDILEPMGVNVSVFEPLKGTYINSNQTAKQTPVTALSKLNVRELVIYLQDEIEAMLQNYQWEFNTPALRATIKSKADSICNLVAVNGGIEKYFNVCDTSNNTDDVINNEMIVLSTLIEPGMGCGKMVQELTIYKRGGMSAVITES